MSRRPSFMKAVRLLGLVLTILLGRLPAAEPIAAFTPDARILFQGDSITDGNRGRSADPNHILGHGYVFIIAAKYGAAFAAMNLDFVNRGSSGNTVRELQKRWEKDTLELKPDLLSILIGVNDQSHDVPLDEYERTYDELITQAKTANPKLRLVLCEPFTLPVGKRKEGYEAWRAGIQARQDVVAKLAAKHDAALVHFQPVFDGSLQSRARRALDLGRRASDLLRPPTNGRRMGTDGPREMADSLARPNLSNHACIFRSCANGRSNQAGPERKPPERSPGAKQHLRNRCFTHPCIPPSHSATAPDKSTPPASSRRPSHFGSLSIGSCGRFSKASQ